MNLFFCFFSNEIISFGHPDQRNGLSPFFVHIGSENGDERFTHFSYSVRVALLLEIFKLSHTIAASSSLFHKANFQENF